MNAIDKLKFYRKFLKLAGEINWYNYRSYSIRKIQDDFRSISISIK